MLRTRSIIHDKVRELNFSQKLEDELINYLDGKQLADGRPYAGKTPHQRVHALGGQTQHIVTDLYTIILKNPTEAAEGQKLCRIASQSKYWEAPSSVVAETVQVGPTEKTRTVDTLTRQEMQDRLKAQGIPYGGRTSDAKLLAKCKRHGLV